MKTININISRVFHESKGIIRDRMIRLEGEKNKDLTLSSLMSSIGWKFVVLTLKSTKKATDRIRLYHKFTTYISVMNRRHGSEFTVKYLKACNLAISKFLAGEPVKSLREIEPDLPLPRLSKSGLPVIIGTRDRRSLHSNSTKVIRLYLNLFSLYRIISAPTKSKLNTITDPFSGNSKFLEITGSWFESKTQLVIGRFADGLELKRQGKFLMSEKSSPSNSKSWVGLLTDISLLKSQPKLFQSLIAVMQLTLTSELFERFINLSKLLPGRASPLFDILPMKEKFRELLFDNSFKDSGLGQLSCKKEAAGKLRVFAMVDAWTQTACQSLHDYLMNLLSNIPNDGSRDHGEAFEKATQMATKYGCCYGYDLSAATDRLPISIQIKILGSLFGKIFAENWANLLIGRRYFLSTKKDGTVPYTYAVGQPMGAKSSWAMLALTHHMVMQYCSYRLWRSDKWETRYIIVGDDIVIFNKELANEYLLVMGLLGVPINVSKSVVSKDKPVVEFVKRLSVNGKEVSALSWKQFLSQDNLLGRISTAVGLFLKEKSFTEKPISVFNTILKEKLFDTRVHHDALSLCALYVTYAFKTHMTLKNIVRVLCLSNPVVFGKTLRFENFDFLHIGSKIKDMIQDGRMPLEPSFHADFLLINKCLVGYFGNKFLNIRRKFWINSIREKQSRIIYCIIGYNPLYPNREQLLHLGLSSVGVKNDAIMLLILEEMEYWMRIQDPLFGYPWVINSNLDPQRLMETYSTLDPLVLCERMIKDWEGRLSFLDLPSRIDKQVVDTVRGISDTSILRLIVSALDMVREEKEESRKARVDSEMDMDNPHNN